MAKEKENVIDLRTKVKVKVTDKNPHAPAGMILEVHPIAATYGEKKGYYEKVKDEKGK